MILHHAFIRTAKRLGSKPAIIDRTLERRLSYDKTLIASLIFADYLKRFREGFIGVMIPTSSGSILATLGTVMAGKVPVMINYSTGAAENCEYAQTKCGFSTIITSKALLEKINCRVVPGMIFVEDILAGISVRAKLKAALRSKLPAALLIATLPSAKEDDTVVILFTSGSEKDPKGVQLTHRNFSCNITDLIQVFQLSEKDRFMGVLPLFHVFGHNANFWLPLVTGMTNITVANPLEYKTIPKIIREEQPTLIAGTPIFFAGYLRESEPGDFASLRLVLPGADKTPDWLREGYRNKHGIELMEAYGTTETSPGISVNTLEANKPGSIGRPLPSVQVRIADLETGEPLPPNQEGKILVKGELVMKGYFDDLEETSLRIKDGWYDTGDMGIMDEDGFLWHRGRLKRFVKIGGEMVSLVRTESVLEHHLPPGISCCVVEIPDSLKGARIVAAVTAPVEARDLLKKMAKELPAIALPKDFIVLEEMPKMGSGKIDFRAVASRVRTVLQNTR
ncbi:MAG TPA: AMP-binding protein [bacterium]|nr:AMP-binding protein [bacterium]HQG46121.1 AMP-binding protein [bacterium]HQI49291.1 AMP-binding protein [bacterium]HQJ64812.1 AMP-binding protein [bacterium]